MKRSQDDIIHIVIVIAVIALILLTIITKSMYLTYIMFILGIIFYSKDIYDTAKSSKYKTKVLIIANNLALIVILVSALLLAREIPSEVKVMPENLKFYMDLHSNFFKIEILFLTSIILSKILKMKRLEGNCV